MRSILVLLVSAVVMAAAGSSLNERVLRTAEMVFAGDVVKRGLFRI